jgi:hypothetical protein
VNVTLGFSFIEVDAVFGLGKDFGLRIIREAIEIATYIHNFTVVRHKLSTVGLYFPPSLP